MLNLFNKDSVALEHKGNGIYETTLISTDDISDTDMKSSLSTYNERLSENVVSGKDLDRIKSCVSLDQAVAYNIKKGNKKIITKIIENKLILTFLSVSVFILILILFKF